MTILNAARWTIGHVSQPGRMRLYCFSYAGGSAAVYSTWQNALGPEVEVCAIQLPGRGTRMAEPPCDDFPALVDELARVIASQPAKPFALFGHSLGALLAFEVAQVLRRHRLSLPEQLFVSGCRAPSAVFEPRRLHLLPDAEFIEALRRYNGTPADVLDNAELMALLLPMLRADFALADAFQYQPRPPLPFPVAALAGRRDEPETLDGVEDWARESTDFRGVHWFDGDHFFLHSAAAAVIEMVRRALLVPVRA